MNAATAAAAEPRPRRGVSKLRLAGWALLAVVAIGLPFFSSSFRVGQFTLVLCYATAILGLGLLVGFSGQISLGHGAFFALGAYTTSILIEKSDFPHLLTLIPSAAVGFIAGLLFGIPTLRLHGLYLALVTLGLAVATPPIIKRADGLTGGSQGINTPQPTAPESLGLAQDQFIYFLCLIVAVVMFVLVANLLRSRVGRALVGIRDAEIVAKSIGVNLALYKTMTFAISASLAAIGGTLYVFTVGFVSPESFTLLVSITFLAAVVVGGVATVGGAVLGALFIVFVPEYASDISDDFSGVIYGAVLIGFMLFLPQGAMGAVRSVSARFGGRGTRTDAPDEMDAAVAAGAGVGPDTTRGIRPAGP
jgi:branched-chain amino acid transport system permease protein